MEGWKNTAIFVPLCCADEGLQDGAAQVRQLPGKQNDKSMITQKQVNNLVIRARRSVSAEACAPASCEAKQSKKRRSVRKVVCADVCKHSPDHQGLQGGGAAQVRQLSE
eukprot:1156838-Pelagomonas_calceolata.AAC.5